MQSMYHFLAQYSDTEDIVFDLIWKNVALPRVRCFGWLVYLGREKIGELLSRWGMLQAGDETKCKFCGLAQESLDHLFLHCTFVWEVWVDCLSWWGVLWVLPSNVMGLFRW